MLGRTDSRPRHFFVLVLLGAVGLLILFRLGYWQITQHERLAALAEQQTSVRTEQPNRRGTIYDRTGTVVLASTLVRTRIVGAPSQLTAEQRARVAARLIATLKLTGDGAKRVTDAMATAKGYVVMASGLDESAAGLIRKDVAGGLLPGVTLERQYVRTYPQAGGAPNTSLAAHVLGFVNSDGHGQYGVEQRYEEVLGGSPRIVVADRTAVGVSVGESSPVLDAGSPGVDLSLTIDAGLQLALEQELLAAWVADRATSVSAVVMDPFSGAIYAEGSYPSYDANRYGAVAAKDQGRFVDPIISQVYEPGSVFKMLTAVAGLETGVVKPTTKINDSGTLRLDGGATKVSDADLKSKGFITFADVIAFSRNVGAARVALRLGPTTAKAASVLYETWHRLGFGQPTGIDLAGEVSGIVNDPSANQWRQIDLANGSFGQGVAVTPIQLATAYSAMANGGTLVQPHVVEAIGSRALTAWPRAQVLTPALSDTLVGLMNHVVTRVPFYRDRTLVPGYYVGGKTGTAQIWDPKASGGQGGWKDNIFNYSFVGFIGRDHPQLVIAVQIHQGTPTIATQGHLEMPVMSFELFRRIATDAMSTLEIPAHDVATASR